MAAWANSHRGPGNWVVSDGLFAKYAVRCRDAIAFRPKPGVQPGALIPSSAVD